jgi:hypothetical protein
MDFSFAFYGIWNTPAPFETIVDAIKGKVEKESSISINVSYSYQNKKYRYDCSWFFKQSV